MSKTSDRKMSREEFLYHVKYVNWHMLLPPIKTEKHVILLRGLRDEGGRYYPPSKNILYDVVIDNVTGVTASTLDDLIMILRRNPHLKWVAHVLEKNIRIRRIEE